MRMPLIDCWSKTENADDECDRHALDIRFTDAETICVSDAAYRRSFYSSSPSSLHDLGGEKFVLPTPFLTSSTAALLQGGADGTAAVHLAQQLNFTQFTEFDKLLETMDTWIFEPLDVPVPTSENPLYDCLKPHGLTSEPSAISFQHGLLCSAALCPVVLFQLQKLL
ncbi:uncharacterized protein BYT42DRAFT_47286 [Radiomyces spectabilis]|uniref:uncharacterized protein n=1 Tax=Radiomyces spectabilis TaxID=64574 RepID=UPI0022201614|nr:uncharacterized protein BYT42DRAFT_47286 [Radiomyces spectabilis]KAI8372824.1 hypothetical protein BYT42DRAFT_47286 [Radiomyces spectabilis]